MVPHTLSCPYCNSNVTLAGPPREGERIHCPRCDESFLARAGGDGTGDSPINSRTATSDDVDRSREPADRAVSDRRSNRSVARIILAVMAAMALLAFTFAYYTKEMRRHRDRLSAETDASLVRVVLVEPARLPALGYLPSNTDIIVGLHVAELMDDAASHDLVTALRTSSTGIGLNYLEQWTGVKLEDIDHAVLGLRVEDRLIPHIMLVVQTRRPYQAEGIRATLKAGRALERKKKTIYRFPFGQSALEAVLWCAGERTLIVGLSPEDLDEVLPSPIPGVDRFTPPLRELLTQRMSEGTQAWVIGHSQQWEKSLSLLPLGVGLAADWREALAKSRTFGSWIQWDHEVTWNLTVECVDAAAAGEFDKILNDQGFAAGRKPAFLGHRPEAALLAKELAQTLTRKHEANWVNLKAKVSEEAIRRAFATH